MSRKQPSKATSDAIRQNVDSYKETVWSLLALIHELTWDEATKRPREDVEHRHGAPHARPGGDPVTPDLGLVIGDESIVLGDIKMSFASEDHSRAKIAKQLIKYDEAATALAASRSKPPAEVGVVLLTHHTRKTDASDYFTASPDFKPANAFAVVSYVRNDQARVFISLERAHGKLVPSAKDEPLRRVRSIWIEHVLKRFGGINFYDGDPPITSVLQVLWDSVFPELITEESFANVAEADANENAEATTDESAVAEGSAQSDPDEPKATRRRRSIDLTVDALHVGEILRNRFSLRAVEQQLPGAPKQSIVQRAMQELVRLRLAKPHETVAGQFIVSYRKLRPDTLDYFARKLGAKQKKQKAAPPKEGSPQLSLFKP